MLCGIYSPSVQLVWMPLRMQPLAQYQIDCSLENQHEQVEKFIKHIRYLHQDLGRRVRGQDAQQQRQAQRTIVLCGCEEQIRLLWQT